MATLLNIMHTDAPDDTANRKLLIRDTVVEFVSTTVFVYFGTLSVVATGALLVGSGLSDDAAKLMPIAFAFGIAIAVLVYSMGHLTGGHMNPGVTLLMYFRRMISLKRMLLFYWPAQFIGAMVGSGLLWATFTEATREIGDGPVLELGSTVLNPGLSAGNGFCAEFMGSFFFYFVIAQTALDKRGVASSLFPPLAIGLSLVVVHIGLVPFTGCGVNPARTFGPSMVVCMAGPEYCDLVIQSSYWIYWIGPFLASFVVAEYTYWLKDFGESHDEEGGKAPAEGGEADSEDTPEAEPEAEK